jgi:hypothetical protein
MWEKKVALGGRCRGVQVYGDMVNGRLYVARG